MNTSKDQLDRLLRGAAEARSSSATEPVQPPAAAWLMARVQREEQITPEVFRILRQALATVCILMMATGFIAAREIRQHQDGVNLGEVAKSQIANVLFP
jgi:hypothetical protein